MEHTEGRETLTPIAQKEPERILVQVLRWRRKVEDDAERRLKPDDVNKLLAMFQKVSLRDGYFLTT